jgi:hypothetical protein
MLNRFSSNSRKLNRIIPKINTNNLVDTDLTGSLTNIELPTENKFNSNVRSNPNPIKLVNNKGRIHDFHTEILEYSALYVKKDVTLFDSGSQTLTIKNTILAYGTEEPTSENFEVLINGIHLPGVYKINQIENDVVVTIYDNKTSSGFPVLDFNILPGSNIQVIGKLIDVPLAIESSYDIIINTEDGKDIII